MLLDVKRTQKWIDALEANGHRQTTGVRHNTVNDTVCAVGCIVEVDDSFTYANYDSLIKHIIGLNDGFFMEFPVCDPSPRKRHTFHQIANILKIRLRAQQEFLPKILEKTNHVSNSPVVSISA
jgi:hypothetical protein